MNAILKSVANSMTITMVGVLALSGVAFASSPAVVIDVRTPSEFADGHVKEAKNIDFNSASFDSQIKGLDREKSYRLYCRSGNRSGKALEKMKALGFKDVENLGSLESAAKKLGADTVK